MAEALRKLKSVNKSADLVELRIDGIIDLDLQKLLRKPRPKVIVTNRRAEEGGKFTGTAEEQLSILTEAATLGAEYIDIEMSWGIKTVNKLIANSRRASVIVSYHNFRETPDDIAVIYKSMRATKTDIIKIAAVAKAIEDNKKIFDICEKAKKHRQPMIALCMGEYGEISRILAGKHGCFLSFGPLNPSEATALGQHTINDLKNIFRIHTLNSHTKVFGLVGNPVSHSKGIVFHNRVFARRSVNAVYVNFLVDNLNSFFSTYREMITGMSITMPFKQEVIPLLDHISEHAYVLGVVNTVVKQKRKLHGYNTDLPAIASLLKRQTSLRNKNVVVLGTGGTSRTMTFAALANGAHTTVVGRTLEKTQSLARQLGCNATTYDGIQDLPCDILMNGTSVGMAGNELDQKLIPKKFLRNGMIVFDAVYNPPITQLLKDAEAAGCGIITGVEFFNRQAQLQSKLFLESLS